MVSTLEDTKKHSKKFGFFVILMTISLALGFAPNLWADLDSPLHSSIVMLLLVQVLTLGGTGYAFYRGAFLLSTTILKPQSADKASSVEEK